MRAGRSACASCVRSSTSSRATGTSASDASHPRRLGILGGTFNPPHVGHLALARCAREQLALDEVLLMPANAAPNKPRPNEDPGASDRLAMCSLAVADEPGVGVTACELERGGVSYTVDSLQGIHDEHPAVELTLILGADTARTLARWREPGRLLTLAGLAVARREGTSEQEVREALAELHPAPRLRFLALGELPVSSSLVRERVAQGLSVLELVGARVAGYIAEHHLYQSRERVPEGGVA